jgi:hypothetical protein
MLMHADNRGVDHLDSGIMGGRKSVYDAAPDTGPPPTDEAVIACGVRTKYLGKITPISAETVENDPITEAASPNT